MYFSKHSFVLIPTANIFMLLMFSISDKPTCFFWTTNHLINLAFLKVSILSATQKFYLWIFFHQLNEIRNINEKYRCTVSICQVLIQEAFLDLTAFINFLNVFIWKNKNINHVLNKTLDRCFRKHKHFSV